MLRQRKCNVMLVIAGFVGAGKTTISSIARAFLAKQNVSVCYDSLTAFPALSYIFFKVLGMIIYGPKILDHYKSIRVHPSTLVVKRIIKFPKIIKFLIIVVETFSLILRLSWLSLRCRRQSIVIIDEGFINILANYIEILDKEAMYLIRLVISIIYIISKRFKVYAFFLKTRSEVLLARWKSRGYPKTTLLIDNRHHLYYNIYLLNIAREIYSQYFRVIDLDANKKPLEIVHKIILQISCH